MLYFILSRVGCGKTTHIHNLIAQFVENGAKDIVMLVPEQFSFAAERMMLEKLGTQNFDKLDILSFSRLAEKIVPKSRQSTRQIDDAGRAALMLLALQSVRDKLSVYKDMTNSQPLVSELLVLHNEMRQCGVRNDDLLPACNRLRQCLLKDKLAEIQLIFAAYDALVEQSGFSDENLLELLRQELYDTSYFKNRLVFIDGFRGFTQQEFDIIERLLVSARAVYVTLCTDNLQNSDDETDLFSHTKRTAMRLKQLAAKCAVPVAKPQYLSMRSKFNNFPPSYQRFLNGELAALEYGLYSPVASVYEEESPNITVCKAEDIYRECEYVAASIATLVRDSGYRCRDIAVIAGDMTKYEAVLRTALGKCGLPVFEDKRRSVVNSPVFRLVRGAVDTAADGFLTENIMRYLKSGLAGMTTEEISELENYCYLWQINGSKWLSEWDYHPDGFGFEMTDADKNKLVEINALRERAILPLEAFRKNLSVCKNGEDAARAVWALLEKNGVSENLRRFARSLDDDGKKAEALEQERIWNVMIDLLDGFSASLGKTPCDAKRLRDTLMIMISATTLGTIPQGVDEITIGSAARIRTVSPRAVFVMGVNQGVFPALPSSGATITDSDRRTLSEIGLNLSDHGEYVLAEQRLVVYETLCCAKEKLFVSYPERNSVGGQLSPSEPVSRILSLFPKCNKVYTADLDGLFFTQSEKTGFEQYAREMRNGGDLFEALDGYYGENADYADRVAALKLTARDRNFRISDSKVAEKLYGYNINLSASRVEKYYKCAFSYFCNYGLKAQTRKIAEFDPMQRGSVVHHVLETLLSKYSGDSLFNLTDENRLAEIKAIMAAYLADKLGGEEKSSRFMRLYEMLAQTINDVAARLTEEFKVSKFRPVDFELKIGCDGDIPSYSLDIPTGGRISISGAVDRVDTATVNGKTYVRVVDYKLSGKDFKLSDVMHGLNMQMLIYLFTLWKNGAERYGELNPAGVLYYTARAATASGNRGSETADLLEESRKSLRMQGIVLDNKDVVLAMDIRGEGRFIPVTVTDEQMKGDLIGLARLEKLKAKADSLLVEMATELKNGNIAAIPAYGANYKNVCQYCDYASVCFYEEDAECRILGDAKLDEVLKALDEKEGDEQ